MVSKIIPTAPFDCVIFGGAGDLAERKLIPAFYQRQCAGQLTDPVRIIAASRTTMTTEEYRSFAEQAIKTFVAQDHIDAEQLKIFLNRLSYVSVDAASDRGWQDLRQHLEQSPAAINAFYLAVGPALFGGIAERLGENRLVHDDTRIIVEKPIGHDLASARSLNDTLGKVFKENQIFRIDHYLGKEIVQNLMALRFANALYEPVWNANHIASVEITVAETVGLEGRAGYYDQAGALRDMVQNHLLQLLCLVAMEPPSSNTANAVRDEKLKVLHSLAPIDAKNAAQNTVRGQYQAGSSSNGAVGSYLDDLGKDGSSTETFVAIKANVNNWRWAGVPFYLRTGKRMSERVSEIVITFKPIPHSIFGADAGQALQNRLVIRLNPKEGVKQWLMMKDPNYGGMRLRQLPLDMTFAEAFLGRNPDAYERLLMDAMRGDQTLFMRRDEVEAAWSWIDPILDAWGASQELVQKYRSGTWGPSGADALVERDGHQWSNLV